MSALIIMIGLIVLFVIYFIGKGFLAIIDFALDIIGSIMGCGWFWVVVGVISCILIIRMVIV